MRTVRRLVLPVAVAALVATPFAAGQLAAPEQVVKDHLLLQVAHVLPPSAAATPDLLVTTGDRDLDARLRGAGVVRMERVFRVPPRGWRDPVAAAEEGLERWLVARFAADRDDLDDVAARLREHPAVTGCERDTRGTVADTVPNDPDFSNQWGLQNGYINGPKAWDLRTASTRVVAVIDTGTDTDHQDLVANLWANPGEIPNNNIDDDQNGYVDDVMGWDFAYNDATPEDQFGHGVHTMGSVGADTNNSRQVAGVCWSVPVMVVQVFDRFGGGTQSDCAAGMVYAADNGAAVLSMSWGYNTQQQVLANAVNYAAKLDIVQVAAAHNYGSTSKMWPAANERVMGIIATDQSDRRASWSNYGNWCDMAAPGDNILSTYLRDSTAYLSGTSMATPMVAGAAALVREHNPMLDAEDTRWTLCYSAKDLGAGGFDIQTGWGRLDLRAALERASSLTLSQAVANPGHTVTVDLDFPAEPGFVHLLLLGRNGRVPGLALSAFDPADDRQLPQNQDPLLWNFLLTHPTGAGVFVNFLGTLDAAGHGQATFNIPGGALFQNTQIDFAALTFDPADFTQVSSVSCSNRLTVQ